MHREALPRQAGLLSDIPFLLEWHVPTAKVVTDLAAAGAAGRDGWPVLAGRRAAHRRSRAVGGNVGRPGSGCGGRSASGISPDAPQTRRTSASAGTADDSSPFPQLRVVAVTARAHHATGGAVLGQAGGEEQNLLKRLVKRRPAVFASHVTCFDRNFPGYDLSSGDPPGGRPAWSTRVKEGISLPLDGQARVCCPTGFRMTWLNAPFGKKQEPLPVRAAEHNVILPSGDGERQPCQTCTVITTLLDHEEAPEDADPGHLAHQVDASETTFGEDKSTISRRREAHLRPCPELPLPAAGSPGSMGMADGLSARARQRGSRAPHRGRRSRTPLRRENLYFFTADENLSPPPCATPSSPWHIWSQPPSVGARARSRDGRLRPRRPAHPERPRNSRRHSPRAQKARPLSFSHRDQDDHHPGKPQVTGLRAPGF